MSKMFVVKKFLNVFKEILIFNVKSLFNEYLNFTFEKKIVGLKFSLKRHLFDEK